VLADPAVQAVASSVGTSVFNPSPNQGRLFIGLKPIEERKISSARVAERLRKELAKIVGIRVFLVPSQDVRVGARQSKAQYQFTLWGTDLPELEAWTPKVLERARHIPGVVDVSTDREQGGLQASLTIDRDAAARMCVQIQDIDNALNDSFGQRQISTIYTQRNQYRVVLETDPDRQRDPVDLDHVYVTASTLGRDGTCAGSLAVTNQNTLATGVLSGVINRQVPLSAVVRLRKTVAPLVINHQGQFPAITITYNLTPDAGIEEASNALQQAVAELHMPDSIHADFAGDTKVFAQSVGAGPVLIIAALVAVYIVLGVLYESLAHPLTIISTLPSAGLGALLALQVSGSELTVIAFIGIILLIGIVKKNGIMLVDFALEGERQRGLTPEQAIFEACLERFRPIMMTTLAALLGAVPLAIAVGHGAELRRPLGITIIGGLVVSQVLTLYTTPVIYLLLDRLHRRWGGAGRRVRPDGTAGRGLWGLRGVAR
jgi:multidrug efflux pump